MKATTKDNLKWRVDCEFGATAGQVRPRQVRQEETTSTPSTTPSMKWPRTRPDTAARSRGLLGATSSKMEYTENTVICNCKHVTLADIDDALQRARASPMWRRSSLRCRG